MNATTSKASARPRRHLLAVVLILLGVLVGIALAGTTTWMVNASSSNNFCATECHSMQWAAAAYQKGPHYRNEFGVRATCADCHIPFEDRPATPFQYVFGTLWTKGIDGTHDLIAKMRGTIAERGRWDGEKPRLSAQVREWFKRTNSATCRGCHKLDSFSGEGASAFMKMEVHSGAIRADKVDCVQCHSGIAHVYALDGVQQAGRGEVREGRGSTAKVRQRASCVSGT